MDLIDRLREIAAQIPLHKDRLETEEATKTSLVMPFLVALGYEVFNPTEVVPEFTADVGTKRGEKVDYAIMADGQPVLLIECKAINKDLDKETPTQLYRYFSVTSAKFAVLTNGEIYKFFSDLEEPNKLDELPFFVLDLKRFDDHAVEQVKKFSKQSFDIERIRSTANDLKYTRAIKRLLAEEWLNPSEDFVRLFAKRVYSGHLTQGRSEQFSAFVRKALHDFVRDRVNERLQSAIDRGTDDVPPEEVAGESTDDDGDGIVTTAEEIEGYYIVRAIVSDVVDPARVFMRDTKSYCGILLDDNNRKPICRLRFNFSQKYVGLFDTGKNEERFPIERLPDLYKHADAIRETVKHYGGE